MCCVYSLISVVSTVITTFHCFSPVTSVSSTNIVCVIRHYHNESCELDRDVYSNNDISLREVNVLL